MIIEVARALLPWFIATGNHGRAARQSRLKDEIQLLSRGRLIQKILPIQCIPLRRTESRIANNPPQLFFCRAIRHARGTHHIFLKHDGTNIIPAKTQSHLADFQSLRHPARLHVEKVRQINPRDRQHFQIIDRSRFVPMAPAKRGVLRLKTPRDKRGKSARLFLQFIQPLEMIDAVLVILAHAEHHGRGRAHSDLVRGAMHVDPVFGQALQPRDLVADFVIQNFRAAAGNRIEPGIPQPQNRVANRSSCIRQSQ